MTRDRELSSLTELTKRAFGWAGVGSAITLLVTVLKLTVLSRLLTPTDFGIFASGLVLNVFLVSLVQGLFAAPLIQHRDENLSAEMIPSAFCASVVAGTILSLIVFASGDFLSAVFRHDNALVFHLVAPTILGRCVSVVPIAVLQRQMRFTQEVMSNAAPVLIGAIISIGLALNGFGLLALVYGLWAETVAGLMLASAFTWRHLAGSPRLRTAIALVRDFGAAYAFTYMNSSLQLTLQYFFISRYQSVSAVGNYSRAHSLFESIAATAFGTYLNRLFRLFPVAHNRETGLSTYFKTSIELVALVTLPLAGMLCIASDTIVRIVLGTQWSAAAPLLAILSLSLTPRLCYKITEFASYTLGRSNQTAIRSAIHLLLMATALALSAPFGLQVIIVSIVAVNFANYLVSASIARKSLGISWSDFGMLHFRGALHLGILVALLPLQTVFAQVGMSPPTSDIALCLLGGISMITFGVVRPSLAIGPEVATTLRRLLAPFKGKLRPPTTE